MVSSIKLEEGKLNYGYCFSLHYNYCEDHRRDPHEQRLIFLKFSCLEQQFGTVVLFMSYMISASFKLFLNHFSSCCKALTLRYLHVVASYSILHD